MTDGSPRMAHLGFPLYSVMDEETRDVIVSAEGVSGFFVDEEEGEVPDVVFLGVHQMGVRNKTESALLEIRNSRNRKIGEYYAGRVVRNDAGADRTGDAVVNVPFRIFSNRCGVSRAAEIWQRWASDRPLELGEWSRWPASYERVWLHVVQNSWFASGHAASYYGLDGIGRLDAAQFSTRASFYCALGEAVNGPGGYFGSNLDALADCLRVSDGEQRLRRLEWNGFDQSMRTLGGGFVEAVADILRKYSVNLVTD